MKIPKTKTITELRNTIFETFEEVISGESHLITHKNGKSIAMISVEKIEAMIDEIELHKNLAIGYAQAMRGEGITSQELKKRLSLKGKEIKDRNG
jgi:PHD/YefM family antitoxin component YafN of YafNO toxin-antitoxin module